MVRAAVRDLGGLAKDGIRRPAAAVASLSWRTTWMNSGGLSDSIKDSVPERCNTLAMDDDSVETPTEISDTAATVLTQPDATNRALGWAAMGITILAAAEMIGTMTVGLAVNVKRMNFPIRQGYAFLTNLEKSPIGLALIVAALFGAIAVYRRRDNEAPGVTNTVLWIVIGAAAVLGIGTILAVMARFRVAELVPNQPVDSLTRRVLVVFVIRNFGAAIVAVLIAVGALFGPKGSGD